MELPQLTPARTDVFCEVISQTIADVSADIDLLKPFSILVSEEC